MASPQTGDGFTGISNELLEAIYSVNLNGTQFRIILMIIRFTYGFQRKEHDMSVSFISNGTGIAQRQIKRELNSLVEMAVVKVTKEATFNTSRTLALNKNYEEWGLIRHQVTKTTPDDELVTTPGDRLDTSPGDRLVTQERKDKESINKERNTHDDLFERLWKEYPNKKGKSSIKSAAKKKLMVVGEEKMIQAINVYKRDLELNTWKQPMNGDTFFRGRYEDYLENQEEVKEHITKKLELKPFDPSQWQ